MNVSLSVQVGQLLHVGFAAGEPDAELRKLLAAGQRGGIIRFKRNIPSVLEDLAELNGELAALAPPELPLLIAVDQEGGRVARLGAPALRVPPARTLARAPAALVERVAFAQSAELLALGFTMNFAPVLDVDDEPRNPIIGDRAFGHDAASVVAGALAFAAGMRRAGLLSCGKHLPGHGNTTTDSHLELPTVHRPLAELERVEFPPFVAACAQQLDAMMTAHVVYTALDSVHPATMSPSILGELVRERWQYAGVLFSDDLEMKAITNPVAAAIAALRAGVDALLVCSDAALAAEIHAALLAQATRDSSFALRVADAFARVQQLKQRRTCSADRARFVIMHGAHRELAAELAAFA